MQLPGQRQVATAFHTFRTFIAAGVVRPTSPARVVGSAAALVRFGPTPAAGYTAAALRFPDDTAVIDDAGTLTFAEVHRRSNAIANAWRADGVSEGDNVALMIRNHRGWVESVIACSKLGANALFLNTSFSGPQLADVCTRESPVAVVFDEEFADIVSAAARGRRRYVSWTDPGSAHPDPTLQELISGGDPSDLPRPSARGKAIILTSGTTGTPKGASRQQPRSLA